MLKFHYGSDFFKTTSMQRYIMGRHFILRLWLILFLFPAEGFAVEQETENTVHDSFTDYVLNTGDKLRIQVYGEDDLYLETRVSDTGIISYPFLGNIKVIGITPPQLEQLITSQLKDGYLVDPKVSVDILEYRLFYVNGEVEAPGGFPFQPGITVRKAISIAGGFKERASKEEIFIIREGNANGKPAKAGLDDKVNPGDIITVEESFF